MMLKLLNDQGKFKSLWKRNMLKFTDIYLCPLFRISPSYCDHDTPPPSPPLTGALQDISLVLSPLWDHECDAGWCTNEVRWYCRDCTRSRNHLCHLEKLSFGLLYHLINLHESNKHFLAFKSSIKLVTVKLFSKLWATCSFYVSILENYLGQYPNRDKFFKSSLERQLGIYTVMFLVKIYGAVSWRFLKPGSWTWAVDKRKESLCMLRDGILNTQCATSTHKSTKLRLRNNAWLFNWSDLISM